MSVPAGLSDLLARPMNGVARVLITHEAHRKFRWLVLVELTLFLLGCLILLPCIAIAAFSGGDLSGLDHVDFRGRFHYWWQEIVVRVLDPNGVVLAELRSKPADAMAGHGIVAAVLTAARREGVVVVENILPYGTETPEIRHVWYGGRPLLASPGLRSEQASAQVLTQAGTQVTSEPQATVFSYAVPRMGRFVAWLLLLFLACPIAPLMLLTRGGREWLSDIWADAMGEPPPRCIYTIRAESLEIRTVRGSKVRDVSVFDGADLVGVVYGPALGWAKQVRRVGPGLALVSRTSTVSLTTPGELGPAIRDLITASTIRLRTERPELGLLGEGPRPTRCPYCSQLYLLGPGVRCPGCGAPGVLS